MGLSRPPLKGFRRINKIKENINKIKDNIIDFYCLSVNYNNRSPAVGNNSQNRIHCCQQVDIIYKLTKNIVKNNSIDWLYF